MTYGIQTSNNFESLYLSGLSQEVVLARGEVNFNTTVHHQTGTNESTNVSPGLAYISITLEKYAIGMPMLKSGVGGHHTFADGVYMIGGSTRGSTPMIIDGRAEWSSKRHWSETATTITINYLVLPPAMDNSLSSNRISGTVYVLLVGKLPENYNKTDYGIRMYNTSNKVTFDSALMPITPKYVVDRPTNFDNYQSASPLNLGNFPAGVKLTVCSWLGQGRCPNPLRFINMTVQFNSIGTKYGIRPNGFAWGNPWQSHFGSHLINQASNKIRVFEASDYF